MKYEVRYMVDGEEHMEEVDVDTAAEAAELVRQHHTDPVDTFELIQVQLMDDMPDTVAAEEEEVTS